MNTETPNLDTENRILEAAKNVFTRQGMDGARMQNIADEAGINKSLLHYYYRSKEKLFEAVFAFAVRQFFPDLAEIFRPELSVFDKIRLFTSRYIELVSKNRYIPIFVLQEINKNPDRVVLLIKNAGITPRKLFAQIEAEIEAGIIRPMSAQQVIANVISLCIMPVVAQPLMENLLFGGDKAAFARFIEARKTEVAEFIITAIKA